MSVIEQEDAHRLDMQAGGEPSGDLREAHARQLVDSCIEELELSSRRAGIEPRRAARLHFEIARLMEAPLGDFEGAAEHYEKAHALWPEHVPTLRGARRVLARQNKLEAMIPLFDAEVQRVSDPRDKARLYYEKGLLLEQRVGDRQRAREAFRAAVGHDDHDAAFVLALARCERQTQSWRELDRSIERAANLVSGDPRHRAALLCQRARLAETWAHDDGQALELYRAALEVDPKALIALHGLKGLLYSNKRWGELIEVLRLEAACAADPSVRSMAHYRIGRVYVDSLGKIDEGIGALEQAIQETPDDPMVLEELARLYEESERHRDLVSVLEHLVDKAVDSRDSGGLFHRIGQLYEEKIGDSDQAIRWYERELALDRTYLPALQALGRLYAAREQWGPLVEMYRAEAEGSQEPRRRAAAYARVADVLESKLGELEAAAGEHARALAAVAGYPPSFEALSRLYIQANKWSELGALYETAVDVAEDDETKLTYLFKIGRLQEDALGAAAQALSTYRRILEIKPDHVGAMHAIQRTAERAGRYDELVRVLELEAALLTDPLRAVALVHRAGEVLEDKLNDREGALERYRKVVALQPGYEPALASLGRAYYQAGKWDELIEIYRQELRLTMTPSKAAALLFKIGEICEQRVGRHDDAIKAYRQAIEKDSHHVPSLRRLSNRLEKLGQWTELVKVLELELSGITTDEMRARSLFRIGTLYENRLSDPAKALGAYEQALKAVPGFRPALDGRARLLAEAGDWERLVEELAREAEETADPMLALAALLRQGEVWRDALGESDQAIRCFEAVLSRDPGHIGALLSLEQLYTDAQRWPDLARIYEIQARVTSDSGMRIAALRELARLQEAEQLVSPNQARQTLYSILQLVPTDAGALGELERIALGEGDRQLLAHVDATLASSTSTAEVVAAHQTRLAEALEASGDRAALQIYRAALGSDPDNIAASRGLTRLAERQVNDLGLLEQAAEAEATVTRDVEAASRLLLKTAGLLQSAGDTERAAVNLLRSLELNPDHEPVAARLKELLMSRGEVDKLIAAYTQAAHSARSRERSAALWMEVAALEADVKHDVPAALATLRRVTHALPGHVPALMMQAELYMRDGQWLKAAKRFEKALDSDPDPEASLQIHRTLAEVYEHKLGDKTLALGNMQQVLAHTPDDAEVLRRVFEIQLEIGVPSEVAETAQRLASIAADPEARGRALSHLAHIERDQGKVLEAIEHFEQATSLLGPGPVAEQFRAYVVDQTGTARDQGLKAYVRALESYLELLTDRHLRAAVCEELASVLAADLNDPEHALAVLRRGLESAPERVGLRAEVARLLKSLGQYAEAADELRWVAAEDPQQIDTWRELADVFATMQRPTEATLALEPIVALGLANEAELTAVRMRRARTVARTLGIYDQTAYQILEGPPQADPIAELIFALSEGLPKLYPPDLERFGVTARDKINGRNNHSVRALAERVAELFGVAEFDVFLSRAGYVVGRVELTDPVAIILPADMEELREAEQTFILGRLFSNLGRKLHLVDKLGPQAVELLLAAAAKNADPSYVTPLANEESLVTLARRVSKSLSWVRRRGMEEAALRYASEPRISVAEWYSKVHRTASRAAVVLADDLAAGIEVLRRYTQAEDESQKSIGTEAAIRDLTLFWVSDAALDLRRKLGML